MTTLHAPTVLTPEEKLARRSLILRDALALLTLFLMTAVLFALTLLLYRSFENHRVELWKRWKSRGELALHEGRPKDAVEDLRSALAYVPDRETETDLATALAAAGRTTEASAYFNTLWETTPGDGTINLQLARLEARVGNERLARFHYESALDGTWNGNGYEHRRQVRLELAGYYLSRREYDQARTQLLIAASNAPDDPSIKIGIAGMLEQAQDPKDALTIYRAVASEHAPPMGALEGAGRTAYALGMYRVAAIYLGRAIANPLFVTLPEAEGSTDRAMLDNSNRVLLLYPDLDLPARKRAERILAARGTARKRLTACADSSNAAPAQLSGLVVRWDQLPGRLTADQLEQQPDLEQTILQLVYDTEKVAAQVCGVPTGDDAVLLRIAGNPTAVEQE
jgi:Tfp pilus assembly protein PilF